MKKIYNSLIALTISTALLTGCSGISSRAAASINNNSKNITSSAVTSNGTQINNNQLNYYFSKANQRPDIQLIKEINSSKATLDIAIYSLTKTDIVNSIISAKKRGVSVRIITDKVESNSKSQSRELRLLKSNGIPIKYNTHSGLMHMKVSIIDKSIVTTGSFNYTNNASYTNDEVLVIINNSTAAADFESQFNRMWNDNKSFTQF